MGHSGAGGTASLKGNRNLPPQPQTRCLVTNCDELSESGFSGFTELTGLACIASPKRALVDIATGRARLPGKSVSPTGNLHPANPRILQILIQTTSVPGGHTSPSPANAARGRDEDSPPLRVNPITNRLLRASKEKFSHNRIACFVSQRENSRN